MQKANIISSVVLLLFSLITLFHVIPTYCDSGFGTGIAPSTFPYILTSAILFLSILLLLQNIFQKDVSPLPVSRTFWRNMAVVVLLIGASLICLYAFGYIGGGIFTTAVFLRYLRTRFSLAFALTVAGVPMLLYIGLFYGLGAPMPEPEVLYLLP